MTITVATVALVAHGSHQDLEDIIPGATGGCPGRSGPRNQPGGSGGDAGSCGAAMSSALPLPPVVSELLGPVSPPADAPEGRSHGAVAGCARPQSDEGVAPGRSETPGKTTICHATRSERNPYITITVSNRARAHGVHQDGEDVIPAPSGVCPGALQSGAGASGGLSPPFPLGTGPAPGAVEGMGGPFRPLLGDTPPFLPVGSGEGPPLSGGGNPAPETVGNPAPETVGNPAPDTVASTGTLSPVPGSGGLPRPVGSTGELSPALGGPAPDTVGATGTLSPAVGVPGGPPQFELRSTGNLAPLGEPARAPAPSGRAVPSGGGRTPAGSATSTRAGGGARGASPGGTAAGGANHPADAGRPAEEQETAGRGGLAFTGIDLWLVTLVGLASLGVGLALRRASRTEG